MSKASKKILISGGICFIVAACVISFHWDDSKIETKEKDLATAGSEVTPSETPLEPSAESESDANDEDTYIFSEFQSEGYNISSYLPEETPLTKEEIFELALSEIKKQESEESLKECEIVLNFPISISDKGAYAVEFKKNDEKILKVFVTTEGNVCITKSGQEELDFFQKYF